MRSLLLSSTLLWATLASAQNVIENLSFGHKGAISPNSFNIPGWSMLGQGHVPQLLSDKVILTPPYGGNKRGAIWTEAKSTTGQWLATLDFRAGGQDRAGGNMQVWYVKDGSSTVSTGSIYTAGKFDGLALVVDTNAGVQKIRGFLNDGTIDYRNHQNVDGLAFGHCDFNYRNLGRPVALSIKSTAEGLEVTIDGRACFNTAAVTLPADYNFGITAASSDPPDSFEAFKFQVTDSPTSSIGYTGQRTGSVKFRKDRQVGTQETSNDNTRASSSSSSSSDYVTSDAQFADLHSRLQQLSKSISNMFVEINRHTQAEEQRYQEILKQLQTHSPASLGNLESRISNLDRQLSDVSSQLRNAPNHKQDLDRISAQLQRTHEGITEHLPGRLRDYVQNHTPRIGFIVFSFMAFQSCCLAFLLWQKWRKSTLPKKYL